MENNKKVTTKLHVKKGDTVMVISGASKGKKGRVLEVIVKTNRAIIEGLNIVKRHTKPNAQHPNGGIIEKEAPIHISNLKVVDNAGNATRIGRKLDENGKLVRYSKKSGEVIK
ncbi:MAG TPA: 50S ribosomal protein L24 [Bacteroidia bacterium]|jgi:large subunit ribosomal protein L24|nr:50S ribosomal protein L24 [Bacteroidia bacterium]MBP7261345.1 50S ribosomal protein L24 [Bacteroidia bacterium]MBP9180614.1 50S ribosomal protein L24 [Bacteroidia bacterium]MBP9724952.1 50S ribosomal protein L24 [Bacteroidia bacterium]HLP32457.1 50S ribosomal protein L24 [Bacteroidia bacterium]